MHPSIGCVSIVQRAISMINYALRGASEPYGRFVCSSCHLKRNVLSQRPQIRSFSESHIGGWMTQSDGSRQQEKPPAESSRPPTLKLKHVIKILDPTSLKGELKAATLGSPELQGTQSLEKGVNETSKASKLLKKKKKAGTSHLTAQKKGKNVTVFFGSARTLEEALKGSNIVTRRVSVDSPKSKPGFTVKSSSGHTLQNKLTFTVRTKQGSHTIKTANRDLDYGRSFAQRGTSQGQIFMVDASTLNLQPLNVENQPHVPSLSYGLERVLFNPGVYHLQDPRSRVYNFDPYLQSIMPVAEFDFNALKEYITSSQDDTLLEAGRKYGKKYMGSSSSMTSALSHFHFLLSHWREINMDRLSRGFPAKFKTFTILTRSPTAIFLRWNGESYAIDADKEFDTANILSMLGKSMEKLLTLQTDDFERYRKSSSGEISEAERTAPESFHYTTFGDFLMRSQLDAHDHRLPGTGMFDLKTRAVVSIRMDATNYHKGLGYEIKSRFGEWESFEREYFDMIRAAFLKYSLQVRMGRMDGIFVAFHNTERIFGFQYISLPEMDSALHGTECTTKTGDQEFVLSLELLNKILDRATAKFPKQSLRIHFETREAQTPFMYIFAEPVTEEQISEIQTKNRTKIEEFERTVLGLDKKNEGTLVEKADDSNGDTQSEWEDIQAKVEQEVQDDEKLSSQVTTSTETPEHGSDKNSDVNSADPSCQSDMEGNQMEQTAVLGEGDDDGKESSKENGQGAGGEKGNEKVESSEPDGNEKVTEDEQLKDVNKDISQSIDEERLASDDEASESGTSLNAEEVPQVLTVDEESQRIGDSEADADKEWIEQVLKEQQGNASEDRGLLAMTLTVRNKVNGNYVLRPGDMNERDKWAVEYSLAEVASSSRAWSLYGACQTRRRKALEMQDEGDDAASYYIRKIWEMSEQGRAWRKNQDKIDAEVGLRVLGQSTPTQCKGQPQRSDESERLAK